MKLNKRFMATVVAMTVAGSMFVGCAKTEAPAVTEGTTTEENKTEEADAEVIKTDVVVIGAGGGGLSSAIEAHDAGANVIVVEKMPFVGGNTSRATGGINAAGSVFQAQDGIEDSPELHYADAMKGGEDKNDPELLKFMTENAADAIDWLTELGADVSEVGTAGGASAKRIHRPVGGGAVGDHLVGVLSDNAKERGIEVMLQTEATEILMEDGQAVGIKAVAQNGQVYIIEAESVVIAAGGFGNNEELFSKYQPQLKGYVTTNQPGATGDGILLGEAVGADLTDIEEIQIHPTVEQASASLITEGVRGDGAILVNRDGVRFTNELLTRDKVSANILAQEGQSAFLVFDQHVRDTLGVIEKYISQGFVVEAATLPELAEKIGVDGATLEATVAAYTADAKNNTDTAFERDIIESTLEQAPYYAMEIAPGVHHTMGGLKINADAQVISTEGAVIEGLYAAGEVTGGVHGAERLGGNALTDIIVFGRESGINAAEFAMADGVFVGAAEASADGKEEMPKINPEATAQYTDGTYTGEAQANNGPVKVEVIVKDGFIDAINVLEHKETATIFKAVEEQLIPSIIYGQTAEGVDAVSGASNSSDAVVEAVTTALSTAK